MPADDAGSFRVETATWAGELQALGWLSPVEAGAAARLHEVFERSGIRPRITAKTDTPIVGRCTGGGDSWFERLSPEEMLYWRRMHRMLDAIPPAYRHQVEAVVCWGTAPWSVRNLQAGLAALARVLR